MWLTLQTEARARQYQQISRYDYDGKLLPQASIGLQEGRLLGNIYNCSALGDKNNAL